MWTLLLLAATVRSFAHVPVGISDRNTNKCHNIKAVLNPGDDAIAPPNCRDVPSALYCSQKVKRFLLLACARLPPP